MGVEKHSRVGHRRWWPLALAILAGLDAGVVSLAAAPVAGPEQDDSVLVIEEATRRGKVQAVSIGPGLDSPELEIESRLLQKGPAQKRKRSSRSYLKWDPSYLTLVYSAETGLYWWWIQGAGQTTPDQNLALRLTASIFYLSQDEILSVEDNGWPASFWLRRSTQKAESMSAAWEEVLHLIRGVAPADYKQAHETEIFRHLRESFYRKERGGPTNAIRLDIEITEIKRPSSGGWQLLLKSYSGRRAILNLDEEFEILSVEQLEETPGADSD